MARQRIVPSTDGLEALRKLAFGPWRIKQRLPRPRRPKIRDETDQPSRDATTAFAPFTAVALNVERDTEASEDRLALQNEKEAASISWSPIAPSANDSIAKLKGRLGFLEHQNDGQMDVSKPALMPSSSLCHTNDQTSDVDKATRPPRTHRNLPQLGSREEAALLYSKCLELAETGDPSDWAQLRNMVLSYSVRHYKFWMYERYSLVERLLNMPEPKLEAVELLLLGTEQAAKWTRIRTTRPGSFQFDRGGLVNPPVAMYLQTFCHHHRDLDTQFAETVKIYRGLQLLSRDLHADLMLPLLRSARYTDHADRAHKMFAAICDDFNLTPSTKTFQVLLQCFCRVAPGKGDWSRANGLIRLSHDMGYSRTKSSTHASLVLTAAIPYAQTVNPTRLHDFLTFHVQESGLIPTRTLNRWVFTHFFESERFDLAQKWAHLLYSCFPGSIHHITDDPRFAHDLSFQWQNKVTSCTDILTICKILTHGAVRSPFSENLHLLIRESVIAHLRKQAKHAGLPVPRGRSLEHLMDMTNLLDSLQRQLDQLPESRPQAGWPSKQILVYQELQSQVDAARTIMYALDDYTKFIDEYLWITAVPLTPPPSEAILVRKSGVKRLISLSGQDWLQGSIDERLTIFKQEPSKVALQKLLDDMIVCLSSEARYIELASLLYELHPLCTSAKIMTPKLVRTWIDAAFRSLQPRAFRSALWALVELHPGQTVPLETLLFVCTAVTAFERSTSPQLSKPPFLQELRYLRNRIFRRWWSERRYPDLSNFDNSHLATGYRDLIDFDSRAHRITEVLRTLGLQ